MIEVIIYYREESCCWLLVAGCWLRVAGCRVEKKKYFWEMNNLNEDEWLCSVFSNGYSATSNQ
jgi:hypothetical protein